MKTLQEIKAILSEQKEGIYKRYGVKIIGIFGSYTRDEQKNTSDVDILIEIDKPIGLKFYELWDYLEKLLECRVDLVRRSLIREDLKDHILKEAVNL